MARFRDDDQDGRIEEPAESEYKARRVRGEDAFSDTPEEETTTSRGRRFADDFPEEDEPAPKKKKKKGGVILWIILIVAILVLLGSGGMVVWEMLVQPAMNDSMNDEIRALAGAVTEVEDEPIDFDALRAVNSDIVGWIKVPNTVINYPVLQSSASDPEYYLYRDYKKNDTKYGSVFLDAGASIHRGDKNAKSLTLYGHHMNDGRMFAEILKYDNLDFFKRTPTFKFDTYEETGTWKVISIFKTNVLKSQGEVFQYVRNGFSNDEDFLDFVHNIMIRSIINTGVKVNEDDQLLVLSTCSYEFNDFRTVLVARRVRDGEDKTVDVAAAAYNNAPLYPDVWYGNGGNKPIYPQTFKEAQAQQLTYWYDGDGLFDTPSVAPTSDAKDDGSSAAEDDDVPEEELSYDDTQNDV